MLVMKLLATAKKYNAHDTVPRVAPLNTQHGPKSAGAAQLATQRTPHYTALFSGLQDMYVVAHKVLRLHVFKRDRDTHS